MNISEEQFDIVAPKPQSFLQSARSFGYSLETAISDLLDNSITAGANRILISFAIDKTSSYLRIEDNGKGMSERELLQAMRFGSFSPLEERETNDLGRFGLGLKTASFSQCKRLTVKTRLAEKGESIKCWDLDLVEKNETWILLRQFADKVSEKNMSDFSFDGSGTIILWEKLDRLLENHEEEDLQKHFYRKVENVKQHIGLVFYRFLEAGNISIEMNGHLIMPINPFIISERYPTQELQEEKLSIKSHVIKIQPYLLPHESKLSKEETERIQLFRGVAGHQGIYLFRQNRLILDGTWLDLGFKKKESQRLCRISIDIPNTLDKEWQIDVKKASAKVPDAIRKLLKETCLRAIEKAVKVYTHRGAYVRRIHQKKEVIYLWNARQKQGKKFYEVNRNHPIYEVICRCLGDKADIFESYIHLIGEAVPVGIIVNDFSDPKIIIKDFFEQEKEDLSKIYLNMIDALQQSGLSEEKAKEKLRHMDCFQNFK